MGLRAFILIVFLATGGLARAQIPREDFRWRIPIQGPLASGTLYKILLPPSLFDGSHAFPSDLRVQDEDGHDWPFFIEQPLEPGPLIHVPLVPIAAPADYAPQQDIQSIFYDAQFGRNPLRYLVPQVEDKQFTRPVKVFGRHTTQDRWRWMADGAIHRIEGLERNQIDLHNNGFRYLRLDLYNYEEPALTITNAYALAEPQYLFTLADGSNRAWLYFGSDTYLLPRFDLRGNRTKL